MFNACSQAIPNNNERNGNGKDQCGDSVYLRSDAAAQAAPNFEGQRVVAADQKKGYGDLVHRKSEDEQSGSDQGELEIRQGDTPESLPGRGTEIERGFFLCAIGFLKAGEKLGGRYRDECSAVAEKNGQQAELQTRKNGEHEQRKAGDDAGKDQREKNEAAE